MKNVDGICFLTVVFFEIRTGEKSFLGSAA
jgi:hypothetical protein